MRSRTRPSSTPGLFVFRKMLRDAVRGSNPAAGAEGFAEWLRAMNGAPNSYCSGNVFEVPEGETVEEEVARRRMVSKQIVAILTESDKLKGEERASVRARQVRSAGAAGTAVLTVSEAMMMNHVEAQAGDGRLGLQVRQIRFEGIGINSYELVDPVGKTLPAFEAGAHVDIHLGEGLVRQYSLCNDPAERHRYLIAVLRDENGRGGSRALHERLRVQDIVTVSVPRNNFGLDELATKVVLLAGGIGVTPLKAMAHELERCGIDYEFHYCAKAPEYAAFRHEVSQFANPGRHYFHFDGGNPADGLNIAKLLREPEPGTHLYYCGPPGFMKACAAAAAHWPAGTVHFEHFKAPTATPAAEPQSDGGFCVKINSTGATVNVEKDQSIVDALASAGFPVETSCQSGLCGSCKVRYLAGEVEHRDCILSDAEHEEFLTCCVSRARTGVLVLDL